MKRLFCFIAALCIIITAFSSAPNIDASSNFDVFCITAEAKSKSKVKLNKTKLTVTEGKTYKLKLTGNKKKVKWSSSKKAVATVNQKGKIRAIAKGKATITAKVGKKKYKCKVTVKEVNVDTNKIKANYYDTGKGVVAELTNNDKVDAYVCVTVNYYDEDKNIVDTGIDDNSCLEKGERCSLFVPGPFDASVGRIAYDSYDVILSAKKSQYAGEGHVDDIKYESNKTEESVVVNVKNSGKTELSFVNVSIVFFDYDGKCISHSDTYANCTQTGSESYIRFEFPQDSEENMIVPASYTVYINHAY